MALAVEANLTITIDGQGARLSGSGRQLTLTVDKPTMLRDMLKVSLPNVRSVGDKVRTYSDVPHLLKEAGLTLTIEDSKGPLLILGEGAEGKSYTLPLIGKLEDVALASRGAALRLVFNA